jgi:ABC-type lipoprotein release transport system permease subunit
MIFGLRRAAYGESLGHLSWSSSGTALICVFCLLLAALVALIPAQDAIRIAPAELLKEE